MERRSIWTVLGGLVLMPVATRAAPMASLRYALHVGSADPTMMAVALANIRAILANGPAVIELVANGPGYTMLRADTSPVKEEVLAMMQAHPTVVFAACQNSRAGAAKREGKTAADIPELPGVTDVPAGIVRLAELQSQNYAYIRV